MLYIRNQQRDTQLQRCNLFDLLVYLTARGKHSIGVGLRYPYGFLVYRLLSCCWVSSPRPRRNPAAQRHTQQSTQEAPFFTLLHERSTVRTYTSSSHSPLLHTLKPLLPLPPLLLNVLASPLGFYFANAKTTHAHAGGPGVVSLSKAWWALTGGSGYGPLFPFQQVGCVSGCRKCVCEGEGGACVHDSERH